MKCIPPSSSCRTLSPRLACSGRRRFSLVLNVLFPFAAGLLAVTSAAQTLTPSGGGIPTANQLQQAYDLGQAMASRHFDTEMIPGGGPPPKDLLRSRFDEFMTTEGARFSDAEKEVFAEAYWSKYKNRANRLKGGMTQIDPPNLLGPDTSTTTAISGKTATPGPGTLQLTDAGGNSYFVDVDPNGNYEVILPQGGFHPIKMTFRSATLKAAWRFTQNGTWEQVSAATGTGVQDGMPPGGTAAFALLDECKKHVMLSSIRTSQSLTFGGKGRTASTTALSPQPRRNPLLHLTQTPSPPVLPPDDPDTKTEWKLRKFTFRWRYDGGMTQIDPPTTSAQSATNPVSGNFGQFSQGIVPTFVELRDQTGRAIQIPVRADGRFDGQVPADFTPVRATLHVTGTDGKPYIANYEVHQGTYRAIGKFEPAPSPKQTDATGPTDRTSTTGTSGQVEGQVFDSSGKPVGWAPVGGATRFPVEHPHSLKDGKLDQQLRNIPMDGCTPFDTTDGEGRFKLGLDYQFPLDDKYRLGPAYEYKIAPDTEPGQTEIIPEPTPLKMSADQSSRSSGYNFDGASLRTSAMDWKVCLSYSYTDTSFPKLSAADTRPRTLDGGPLILDPPRFYNAGFRNGTSPDWVPDAIHHMGLSDGDLTTDHHVIDGIGPFGSLQVSQGQAKLFPSNLVSWFSSTADTDRAFVGHIRTGIAYVEEESCTEIALAPTWNPAHWPMPQTTGLPTFHVTLNE